MRLNWCGSTLPATRRPICTPEWEDTSFILQGQLGTYDVHKQVFKSQVASFWGIVDVYASVSLGIRGGLQIDGVIKPMTPSAEADLLIHGAPYVSASVWIDILWGVVSAGASADVSVGLELPLHLNTRTVPSTYFGHPSMEVKVTLDAWAEVDVWWYEKHWDVGNYTLINYPDTGSSSTLSMCLADTPTTLHATTGH